MEILEGKFLGIGENYDEVVKNLPEDFQGYLRISTKKNGQFEEGYVFFKDKEIIGYYYNYEKEVFGADAKDLIEEIKKQENQVVDIFAYDSNKLKLMMELYGEIFLNKNNRKNESMENQYIPDTKCQNINLSVPEGKPIKTGVIINYDDYNKLDEQESVKIPELLGEYLEGYRLLDIFKKADNGYKRGYIIFKDKVPFAAAYQDLSGAIFGEEAYNILENIIKEPGAIVDIYEYDSKKLEVFLELYPNAKLEIPTVYTSSSSVTKDIENDFEGSLVPTGELKHISDKSEETRTDKVDTQNESAEEPKLSREELLKKFGIQPPDEDMVNRIIQDITVPDASDLKKIEEELKEKIENSLKGISDIENFLVSISVKYDDGYSCICNVKITPKKVFGVIKKKINPGDIEDLIQKILDNYIIDMDSSISIELE